MENDDEDYYFRSSEEYKDNNNSFDDFQEGLRDDLDESGLLEELMGFNQTSGSKAKQTGQKGTSQKPLQTENDLYEPDVSRKIILFPLIVDLDMIVKPLLYIPPL